MPKTQFQMISYWKLGINFFFHSTKTKKNDYHYFHPSTKSEYSLSLFTSLAFDLSGKTGVNIVKYGKVV